MATTVTMPSLGESVAEGEIGKWLVTEGQSVSKDDPLVEILTDKADSEVPAPEGGVVTKIVAQVGDMVAVGDVLCELDAKAKATSDAAGAAEGGGASAPGAGTGAGTTSIVASVTATAP